MINRHRKKKTCTRQTLIHIHDKSLTELATEVLPQPNKIPW